MFYEVLDRALQYVYDVQNCDEMISDEEYLVELNEKCKALMTIGFTEKPVLKTDTDWIASESSDNEKYKALRTDGFTEEPVRKTVTDWIASEVQIMKSTRV